VSGEKLQPGRTGAPSEQRDYAYDADGQRTTMTATRGTGTPKELSYGFDAHGSVSLLLDSTGKPRPPTATRPTATRSPR
jgi:YD repeat-containing protein